MALTVSSSAFSNEAAEMQRFEALCKTDAEVIANGYQFRKSGLSLSTIAETIKNTFSGTSKNAKESSNDALYLINMAYLLNPDLQEDVIREAAFRLCMQEKLSTDR